MPTTSEDRATQLLICATLNFAILIEISKKALVLIVFRLRIGRGLKMFGNTCERSARHNLGTPPSTLLSRCSQQRTSRSQKKPLKACVRCLTKPFAQLGSKENLAVWIRTGHHLLQGYFSSSIWTKQCLQTILILAIKESLQTRVFAALRVAGP